MKLQKIILCVAVALTAFGASLGLLEVGSYLRAAFQPDKREAQTVRPIPAPTAIIQTLAAEPIKAPETTPPEVSNSVEDDASCDIVETGDYALYGKAPKGFEDFDTLNITARVYTDDYPDGIAVKPQGALFMKKEFRFSRTNINVKRISFVTKSRQGVSYQFDGKFVEEKVTYKQNEEHEQTIVLKGRLTKWLNGVKTAEAKVRFLEMCGC
jgi:hypothetical protein